MSRQIAVALINPGAESGTTGWTDEIGGLGTRSATPDPYAGSAYFFGGAYAETLARQRVDLVAAGASAVNLDAGTCSATVGWQQASFDGTNDPGACGLRFLDASLAVLSTSMATDALVSPALTWAARSHSAAIPAGARYVDVLIHALRAAGTNNDGYFDALTLTLDVPVEPMPPLAFEFDFAAPSTPIAFAPPLAFEFDFPAPSVTLRHGVTLTAVRRIPIGRELTAVRRLPLGRILTAVRRIPAPLGVTLTAVRRIPVEVGAALAAVRRILDHNPLGVVLTARRRIPSAGSALMRSVPWSAVWDDDGAALELLGATLSGDRDSLAWSCDLSLADAAAYAACTPGRRLTLTLAGRAWALLIEGRTREAACGTRDYAATARTVSCLLDAPYAALLTQSWPAVTAKTAATALAALAGLSLDWQVVDWVLPAGRLTAEAETPAALIARLAASCGAVAIPDPAGGVIVRYAYPVGVPEMATATPAATLSDDEDVETLAETFVAGAGYNAVTVVDNRQTTEAYLAWELDSDRNAGRSTFPPGEPCWLRVYHEEDYTLKTSLGLLELVTADVEETVDKVVGFADADSADLGGLVIAVTACVWYGPDLGTLVPAGGGTVTASAGAGFSVAAVTYRTRYDLWRLTAPAVADAYTIQLGLEEVEP